MKIKKIVTKIWLFSFLSLFCIIFSQVSANDYEYTNYDITANILTDWTIDVKEDITANFFVKKHGIIRIIPLNYSVEWNKFHIYVKDIKVKWEKVKTTLEDNEWDIRIWKANKTIIWKHTYPISYSTYGLIRNFSWMWYSELYWNLIGYDFDTNINNVRAEIILPKPYTWFTNDDFLITTDWKTTSVSDFKWTIDWSQWDRIIITYDKWLPAFQWITLSVKFPNNYFEFNHRKQKRLIWDFGYSLYDAILHIRIPFRWKVVILIFLICAWLDIRKSRQQRQLKNKYPIVAQYTPPKNLSASEMCVLYGRMASADAVKCLIYQRAGEWYISFERRKWFSTWIIKKKDLNCTKQDTDDTINISDDTAEVSNNTTNIFDDKKVEHVVAYFNGKAPHNFTKHNINDADDVSDKSEQEYITITSFKDFKNVLSLRGKEVLQDLSKQYYDGIYNNTIDNKATDDSYKADTDYLEHFEDFERETRKALFPGKCSKVRIPDESFNSKLFSLEEQLYLACVPKRWFEKTRPSKDFHSSRQPAIDTYLWKFAIAAGILLILSIFAEAQQMILVSFICWALALIFSKNHSKWLTEEWFKLLSEIKWYGAFIQACDENRLKIYLKDDPLFFDKILPYAVAFWLETKLMKSIVNVAKEIWMNNAWYVTESKPLKILESINNNVHTYISNDSGDSGSSYSSSSGHSSGSSFSWWFSSGGWGWWGGWRSW